MRTFRPSIPPKDIDPRVWKILKEHSDQLRQIDSGLGAISRGDTPDQSGAPIPSPPPKVDDHGDLDGLVPIVNPDDTIADYNDDHTQYPLIFGRPGGQEILGGRTAETALWVPKGNLLLDKQDYDAPGTPWAMDVAEQGLPDECVVLVLTSNRQAGADGATNEHSAVADTQGHTWTKHKEYTFHVTTFYRTVSIWTTLLTSALVPGTSTVTATFASNPDTTAAEAYRFGLAAGLSISMVDSTTGNTATDSLQPDSLSITAPAGQTLFVRGMIVSNTATASDIGFTPTSGFAAFTDDTDHTNSSSQYPTNAKFDSQARGEWRVLVDQGATSAPTCPPVYPTGQRFTVSMLVALQVSTTGVGLLTLKSADQAQAASLYLTGQTINANFDFFNFRAPGGSTTLSYIRGSDGAFIGPVTLNPLVNLLNTSLFNDVVAGTPVAGDLMVGNTTPKWTKLNANVSQSVLWVNNGLGNLPAWTQTPRTKLGYIAGTIDTLSAGMGVYIYGDQGFIDIASDDGANTGIELFNNLHTKTGALYVSSTSLIVQAGTGTELRLGAGAVNYFILSSAGLVTTSPTWGVALNMGTFGITGIGSLAFTAVTSTIGKGAGTVQNQNLLDKTAAESLSGLYTWTASGITLNNSVKINFGTSAPAFCQFNGTNFQIITTTGKCIVGTNTTTDTELRTNSVTRMAFNGTTGTVTTSPKWAVNLDMNGLAIINAGLTDPSIQYTNGIPLIWGTGSEAQISFSGTNFEYYTNTGSHIFQANGPVSLLNISQAGVFTFVDGATFVLGSTTGTKIGTATTQKLGFFNATPVVQPANTAAINDLLVTLGLRATGGVSNFTTNLDVSTKDIVTDTTTGTKLGTAASQKIGVWNATPIVQPTTAGAAATFVTNTSLIANDTATFDGYTIGQVVKALRNIGILA